MKAAKFDIIKTFENYTFEDIKFPASLTADDIIDCSFVPKRENLILYGNVGAGKTHLAIATGIAACDAGFRTRFWRTATLVNALIEAKNRGELSLFMKQFDKLDLLICDEWGYVPKRKIPSEFFSLTPTALSYSFRSFPNAMSVNLLSLLLILNLHIGMIFSPTLRNRRFLMITAALLDRVIHHSHLLDFTDRDSRRLLDALGNKSFKN